jgi:hypothetical protein
MKAHICFVYMYKNFNNTKICMQSYKRVWGESYTYSLSKYFFMYLHTNFFIVNGMYFLLAFVTKVTKFSLLRSRKKINCVWINIEIEFMLMNLVMRMMYVYHQIQINIWCVRSLNWFEFFTALLLMKGKVICGGDITSCWLVVGYWCFKWCIM